MYGYVFQLKLEFELTKTAGTTSVVMILECCRQFRSLHQLLEVLKQESAEISDNDKITVQPFVLLII